jgi:hypothetical protein
MYKYTRIEIKSGEWEREIHKRRYSEKKCVCVCVLFVQYNILQYFHFDCDPFPPALLPSLPLSSCPPSLFQWWGDHFSSLSVTVKTFEVLVTLFPSLPLSSCPPSLLQWWDAHFSSLSVTVSSPYRWQMSQTSTDFNQRSICIDNTVVHLFLCGTYISFKGLCVRERVSQLISDGAYSSF